MTGDVPRSDLPGAGSDPDGVRSDRAAGGSDPSDAGSDQVKPWTVKGIPPEDRNAAIAAAERQGMTIGAWLCRAIRTQVQTDAQARRAPVPVRPAPPPSDPQSDLAAVERLVAIAREVNGAAPPRSIRRLANAILRDRLAAIQAAGPTGGVDGRTG